MRTSAPLPAPLVGRIFTVEQSAAFGISRSRTRASDLTAPFRGVRAPAIELPHVALCVAALQRRTETAAVSHRSAALLHSLPVPQRLRSDRRIDLAVPTGARAPRGRGIRGHQLNLRPEDIVVIAGVRTTSPLRTFCDLGAALTLPELVAVADHLVRRSVGRFSVADLATAIGAWPGSRGIRKLRRAIELVDPDAESPKESELRVLLIESGLPHPASQHVVRDRDGRFVARIDLAYPDLLIGIEYEGDHHRDRAQWRADLARRRRMEALGWLYIPVTQADLDDPLGLLADLRTAVAARLQTRRVAT